MSRVMEIVSDGPIDVVARRALKAFKRIGKLDRFDPETSLTGRVGINGYTAFMNIAWVPHKERFRLDISARSDDELSRVADQAMYRFLDIYKTISPADLEAPEPTMSPIKIVLLIVFAIIVGWLLLRVLGVLPSHN